MTTKQFNRIYFALVLVAGAGMALTIGGALLDFTTTALWGFTLMLGGFTGMVVTYKIENTKPNTK